MSVRMFVKGPLFVIWCLLAWALVAHAQRPPHSGPRPERGPEHGPGRGPGQDFGPGGPRPFPGGGPAVDFLSGEMNFDRQTVKGAPFSASVTTESVQLLFDGTRVTRKSTTAIYRDAEGRTRREVTINAIGPLSIVGEPPRLVFINDPAAGTSYALNQGERSYRKFGGHKPEGEGAGERGPGGPHREPPPHFGPPEAGQGKTESLGKKTIEGVEAEGTRATITIPVGQIGNDHPIEIVSEKWESPELHAVILSKHRDPRFGETTYSLTSIKRGEQPRTLFEIPGDYTQVEANRPGPPPEGQMHGPRRGRND